MAGTGRQDSLEFQLLDPMADLRVGDALVTFGSKGGRPYAPGLPIGEVTEVGGSPGQLTRVATVRALRRRVDAEHRRRRHQGASRGSPRLRAAQGIGADLHGGAEPGAAGRRRTPRAPASPTPSPSASGQETSPPRCSRQPSASRSGTGNGNGNRVAAAMIWRQGLVIGLAVLFAVIVEVTLLSRLGLPGATPDLVVVTVVALALAMGPTQGAAAGFVAGRPHRPGAAGRHAAGHQRDRLHRRRVRDRDGRRSAGPHRARS